MPSRFLSSGILRSTISLARGLGPGARVCFSSFVVECYRHRAFALTSMCEAKKVEAREGLMLLIQACGKRAASSRPAGAGTSASPGSYTAPKDRQARVAYVGCFLFALSVRPRLTLFTVSKECL